MAPKRKPFRLSPAPIPIGNCEVVVEARNFTSESNQNSLQIILSKNVKIKVSVMEAAKCENTIDDTPGSGSEKNGGYYFVLVNPKDSGDQTKSLLQEVLDMYSKELPAMKFAANTGKESLFLERCVSNGKYCTLLLICKSNDQLGEVLSAITYQIVPADTQYAEIPLAAVSSMYQKKGIGRLLYMELRNRLQKVGIRTILCWGDQESEGFWLKQGFVVIGEVNTKGRARRLPIKAEIRKALCFPGGSTLMVSHLNDSSADPAEQIKLLYPLKLPMKHHLSDVVQKLQPECIEESGHSEGGNQLISSTAYAQAENLVIERFLFDGCQDADSGKLLEYINTANNSEFGKSGEDFEMKKCSCSTQGTKKRIWEASLTSMNSKKVKGGHAIDCQSDPRNFGSSGECCSNSSTFLYGNKLLVGGDAFANDCLEKNNVECGAINETSEDKGSCKLLSTDICFKIMLMNIADDKKKSSLTKIIEDLGGIVTSDGRVSSHVVTGKVRKTLNFCTALCSGAWIISPSWLKESYRRGRFVDEMPYLLKDEDYECKYKVELKAAVLRAKSNPNSLLKGHDICLAAHVQPPMRTLSTIIKSAGGNVVSGMQKVNESSKTIYIASEEDMEEALLAVRNGMQTFGSDWLMTCIMKQELDLEASQFAESL
ncbi:uncharacterized protein LOC113776092 [Coffea eugenioides]|uniref:Microcephalin-like n=1 Tax=Coffea arabica TaxID=13443 RepID=A0A6P6SWT9_COFAR|nr:uncharacterized protein LOC113695397 [Coffea arabica]XP_027176967.1 uncharacterized protein LOC113776092 [Coffea eugenioides]